MNAAEPLTDPEPDLHPYPPEPEFTPVAPALSRLFVWDPDKPPARCKDCGYLPTARGHLIICGGDS